MMISIQFSMLFDDVKKSRKKIKREKIEKQQPKKITIIDWIDSMKRRDGDWWTTVEGGTDEMFSAEVFCVFSTRSRPTFHNIMRRVKTLRLKKRSYEASSRSSERRISSQERKNTQIQQNFEFIINIFDSRRNLETRSTNPKKKLLRREKKLYWNFQFLSWLWLRIE